METLTPIKRLVVGASVVVMALFGFVGYAAAAPVIETHGPNSGVWAGHHSETTCRVVNTTNISAVNNNSQTARSGDVMIVNNTNAGSWSGWSQLDPAYYQAQGYSFASWRSDVLSWLSERQSGDGWSAASDVITISGGANWNSWDPITWQQNGQTFAAWQSGLNVHLNSSYAGLESSWPPEATGMSPGINRSGSASNFSSFSFNISVNNTPSSTTVCSPIGGRGGPETPNTPQQPNSPQPTAQQGGGQGGGSGGGGGGSWSNALRANSSSAPHTNTSPLTPNTPQQPNNPSNPGSSGGSITTHGPNSPVASSGSSSTRTSITNTTSISATNNNPQAASSGSVSAVNNTSVGGSSGGASNNANGAVTMNVRQ